MEVHHPHHPTHKKKWSEYIIEFVMLFAAVTLGFFAENVREHQIIDHKTAFILCAFTPILFMILVTIVSRHTTKENPS